MQTEPTTDPAIFLTMIGPAGSLLAIDLGTKTLGIAASDSTRMIASPIETLPRTRFGDDCQRLRRVMSDRDTAGLVLGLPNNMDGSAGPRVQSARAYARNLAREFELPILLWDERLTTAEAERMLIAADTSRKRRAEVIDKVAATIILQAVLDRLRAPYLHK